MIKPASYWALHKTCDPYTLGRVAVSLGGQQVDPPLNPAEKALVSVVTQDSEWMDERTEAQRERWKDRQRKTRMSRVVTVTNGDNDVSRDVTVTNGDNDVSREKCQCHVTSVRPSVHPSKEIEVCNISARTREEEICSSAGKTPPTWEQVKAHITSASVATRIPEDFARKWFDDCTFIGWVDSKKVSIIGIWRNKLLYAWRDDEKEQRNRNGGKTNAEVEQAKAAEEAWNRRILSEENDD